MSDGKVPKALRRRIMRRDNYTCGGCGLRGREVRVGKGYSYPTCAVRIPRGHLKYAPLRTRPLLDFTPIYLSIDHVRPWSRGGTNDDSNLRVLCTDCNTRKGDRAA